MRATALALLLMVPLLAGCLDTLGLGSDDSLAPTDDPIPVGRDHDHADADQHRFADHATLLDQDDLRRYGATDERMVGAHAMDVHGDLLVVAVFGNDDGSGGQQGFHLFDVRDPEHLQHISFYQTGTDVSGDRTIAFAPDGKTVFLGFESGNRPGIAAVDVSDPTNPHETHFWSDPTGYGPHTVAAGEVDGSTYVFALVYGVHILSFSPDAGFQQVGRYVTADELAFLDAVDYLDPTNPTDPAAGADVYARRSLYAHDTNFYVDPVTGKPLLLVAYAYDGMKVLDITTPAVPVLIGRFLPPEDTGHKHYTHSVTAERLETGEFVIVVGSETFEEANQDIASPVWILDGTAMMDQDVPLQNPPVHVSTWRNPDNSPAGHLGLSVHFFRQQDGFVVLSHYHGGVWAIDLRSESARNRPDAFAYIMPLGDDPAVPPEDCCWGYDLEGAPMVFDVAFGRDGTVYAADIVQGVSSIRLDYPA